MVGTTVAVVSAFVAGLLLRRPRSPQVIYVERSAPAEASAPVPTRVPEPAPVRRRVLRDLTPVWERMADGYEPPAVDHGGVTCSDRSSLL